VYLYAGAIPAWAFYSTDWANPDLPRLRRIADIAGAAGAAFENAASRAAPVACAGDGLQDEFRGRAEIFGVPTGVQALEPRGWQKSQPDSGWSENEVRRILATGARRVWILATQFRQDWIDQLVAGVVRAGGVVGVEQADPADAEGASLYRVDLSQPPVRSNFVQDCPR
jgi:hypothetical protein